MRNCEYIKPNGEFCGSPALRGRDYCHWHLICVARRLRAEKQEATQERTPLELPPLEDANSVQLAIMMVGDAILRNRIGPKMAGQLLYLLQLASSNLKQGVCFQPGKQAAAENEGDEEETEEVVLCSSYDSLEADYDIQEHAGQLKASQANLRLHASKEPDEEKEQEDKEEKELTEEERFMRWVRSQGFSLRDDFGPGSPSYEPLLNNWRKQKQQMEEEHRKRQDELRQHWDGIRRNLAEAALSEDTERLKDLLADCYWRSGLEYEAPGWKPAGQQLVLFPRKPPEDVQQQWYEQRHANCTAEIDKSIEQQEAARKKIS